MDTVTLVLVPGTGAQSVSIEAGTTLAQFAADQNLNGRQLFVNGEGVPPDQWSTVSVTGGSEIFATGSVKGN